MARDISVSIAVQGEKEFNQALKSAQSAVKVLASELKLSEASFEEGADAQQYFASRTRIIGAQIEQQKTILRSLEQAVQEAGAEFGEASTKTDKYRIEMNRTQASIAKLEKSLRETQREAEELGRDSTRVGRQIENGIGDAAEEASGSLDEMVGKLEKDIDDISSAVRFSAFKDFGEMAFDAFNALDDFVDSTKDYRRQMSFLEQNAKDAGFEFEYVKELLFEVSSLTGDTEGAFEGINNLMATGFDAKEMEEAIDLLSGAVIRFPETMKFESLAESLQETVATGAATGQYAELLERLGVDIDEFNEAMANATTEEERQQIALAYLNEHGLAETTENYKEVNKDLIASEDAQARFNDAVAGLGTELQPAQTAWVNFKTDVVLGLTDMISKYKEWQEATKERNEKISQTVQLAVDESELQDAVVDIEDEIIAAYERGDYILAKQLEEQKRQSIDEIGEVKREAVRKFEEQEGTEGKKSLWDYLFGKDELATGEAETAVKDLTTEIEDSAEAEEENMETIGENIATQIGNGIADGTPDVIVQAEQMWQSVNDILTKEITIPSPKIKGGSTYDASGTLKGGGNGLGTSSRVELVAQIDSRTVARTVASDVGSQLGASVAWQEIYG